LSSTCITAINLPTKINNFNYNQFQYESIENLNDIKYIEIKLQFSNPEVVPYDDYYIIRLKESDYNRMDPGRPIIPVNISTFELPFGTKILNVIYSNPTPIIYNLTKKIAFGSSPSIDSIKNNNKKMKIDRDIYQKNEKYPSDWIFYHTGGGISYGLHKTFFVLRLYPVRYNPVENQIHFIQNISLNISYIEPKEPLIKENSIYDMLIISPSAFSKQLEPLVNHKNNKGVSTILITLSEVYRQEFWGRDEQEKIKYFIRDAIESWGIKYVLLAGGIKGQTTKWNLPVRYSHVVPLTEQEYPEESFISDLYYADIYNGEGKFSSWDSINDNLFAEWSEKYKENMDIYPDVYLGRIPCRTPLETEIMVNKIIEYEKNKCDNEWFKNLLLVAGDSYVDKANLNEGELISEKAIELMPGFTPVKVYSSEQDINRKTVNNALNLGCGFAYFCGHGSAVSWNTHFPPATDGNWCTGYSVLNMIPLKNKEKLPITVVGGCHNGKFDISVMNSIKNGIEKKGLRYFGPSSRFWYDGWATNCWAWWLTSKKRGGSIATIANTGLGTHGEDDSDNNSIADYLEVLDGWLELRFFELYGKENKDILGENHGVTITEYLHRFLGDDAKMDVKMVQQWELFGDPTLKIGGYE
jgi:hypothetical protein